MAVKKSQKSLLEKILITIVSFGLSVKTIRSTRGDSIAKKREKPVKKAERKVKDLKLGSSLAKYKLKFEDIKQTRFKVRTKGKK